jgi:hypothetical protein
VCFGLFCCLFRDAGEKDHYYVNLNDEVVRGSIVLNKGEKMWPPPAPKAVAAPPPKAIEVKAVSAAVMAFA